MNAAKIIGGALKGRKILLPERDGSRPTKAIARESIFDSLQSEIGAFAFAELFAGSGSVGLEAISRGAKSAIFIERDKAAFGVLERNIAALKISNAKCFLGDSFVLIAQAIEYLKAQKQKAWFYLDPPFSIREGFSQIYEQTQTLLSSLPIDALAGAIVEHSSNVVLSDSLGALAISKRRKFGKTTLSYYQI
ncbi:MAG: 16S rRNA (guanine(966)-N(2))-methyltransferase RsmD [Helicobacteraceae bacterium]|jgi:16S rRNA (guanine(966)-N(2))-methyltransferase RsmD|nr:16S rRNA (guanine(966)-N(2))-methyltransferase RsmD [Helicobacteraceae bacterium]